MQQINDILLHLKVKGKEHFMSDMTKQDRQTNAEMLNFHIEIYRSLGVS